MSLLQKSIVCSVLLSSQVLLGNQSSPSEELPKAPKSSHKGSHFHGIVASGYAWSMKADIRGIDYDYWAGSKEGYNASLGNSPFIMLGFGYRLLNSLDMDFNYTLYDTFHYQKNQTDIYADGNKRTRFFDLDHQSSIFNFTFLPYTFSFWKVRLTPLLGMGLGIGTNEVSHFQTVFYNSIQGIGLTSSIGPTHTRNSFAWQGMGGLRMQPGCSKLSLDLAYRYYNGGTFDCPSLITDYNGPGFGETEGNPPWKGTLQTNQLYFALNFSI